MSRLNRKAVQELLTHEGGKATAASPYAELRRSVMCCLLWEDTFYEDGVEIAGRILQLAVAIEPPKVAALALEARDKMKLRHVPLLLCAVLAARRQCGPLVRALVPRVVRRPDEMGELLSIYKKVAAAPGKIPDAIKRGLGDTFPKFSAESLAKWNRDSAAYRLRDVLFICHAKPKDEAQASTWKTLIDDRLPVPDTWEVALSTGQHKKATWERLLSEGRLGDMATIMNLRNMQEAGVDESLLRARLASGLPMCLPFRFITAARMVPQWEPMIEPAMMASVSDLPKLGGHTTLLVDVSGSMQDPLSAKSITSRMDIAAGLAILLAARCENFACFTFSNSLVQVPPRQGFALRDAITNSQAHSGTYLTEAVLKLIPQVRDRFIVLTDEQVHRYEARAVQVRNAYMVNVAPYQRGVSYGTGWTHIDGWSERILDFIVQAETENRAAL